MTGQHHLWQDGVSRNAVEYLKVRNLTGESEPVFENNRFVSFGPRAFLFQNFLQHGQEKCIVSVQTIQGIAFSTHLLRQHWYHFRKTLLHHRHSLRRSCRRPSQEWARRCNHAKRCSIEWKYERETEIDLTAKEIGATRLIVVVIVVMHGVCDQ